MPLDSGVFRLSDDELCEPDLWPPWSQPIGTPLKEARHFRASSLSPHAARLCAAQARLCPMKQLDALIFTSSKLLTATNNPQYPEMHTPSATRGLCQHVFFTSKSTLPPLIFAINITSSAERRRRDGLSAALTACNSTASGFSLGQTVHLPQ